MLIAFDDFEKAVEHRLGQAVGFRLRPWAAHQLEGRRDVSEHEAGAALVSAVAQREDWSAARIAIRSVDLAFDGRLITLDDKSALEHPLLADWISSDIAGAVGKNLIAGAAMTFLAPGAPLFGPALLIARDDGSFSGQVVLKFCAGATVATVNYGADATGLPLVHLHQMSGDALFAIGADTTAPGLADGPEGDSQMVQPIAGGVLH